MARLRTRSAGTKVTEEEYAQIEKRAQAKGRNVGEWCREVILAEAERTETPSAETILAEIMALRMVFLSTVQVFGQKGALPIEQLRQFLERADREKFRKVFERVQQQVERLKSLREEIRGGGKA
jgi:hypothetical protein